MLPFPALPNASRLLAGALNALLGREDWARERLPRHAGKTVRFAWGGQGLSLTISSDGRVDTADAAIVPDVTPTLQSGRLDPFRLLGGGRPDPAEFTHIAGDAALAQVVGDPARELRWDPEDELAKVVGDIPATRLPRARGRSPTAPAPPAGSWPPTWPSTCRKKAGRWPASRCWRSSGWTWTPCAPAWTRWSAARARCAPRLERAEAARGAPASRSA